VLKKERGGRKNKTHKGKLKNQEIRNLPNEFL
jgi:hypothetical protein